MYKFSKKTFFIAFFGLLFFSSVFVNIAMAEVTCCGCTRTAIDEMGHEYATGARFDCQEGNIECPQLCARESEASRVLEGVRATGEVVTCCECRNNTRLCNATDQDCSVLCSSNGGFRPNGLHIQRQSTGETTKDEAAKVELIPPVLNIDIPGTSNLFGGGQIVTEGEKRYFYLPFIGQYVSALYNYVLGIVGILAVVVIIFAGVIWLTAGGSPERIKTAQEYIFGAVTGVVLAFGSYLILYTINPDLVRFGAMKVEVVERINFEYALNATTAFTGESIAGGGGGGSGGSWTCRDRETNTLPATPSTTGCPISLTAPPTMSDPNREERTREFVQNIPSQIHGSTIREKVIEVAQAAARCGVHFGSCGRTVGIINALAGVEETNIASCLPNPNESCTWGTSRQNRVISNQQRTYLRDMHCYPGNSNSNCLRGTEAVTEAYGRLRTELGEGWPDSWANELQPGDVFVIFNANSDQWGNHSAIFMGWDGNRARVVEGGYGCFVKEGSICIKSDCSPTPRPLIKIFRPE